MYLTQHGSRFTLHGSRLLDERIKRDLKTIVRFILERHFLRVSQPAAIWLGGSYGRGEGAVYRHDDNERMWFDYDLYIVYRQLGDLKALRQEFKRWENDLSARFGFNVHLRTSGDVYTSHQLPTRLQWVNLVQAHQVIWGDTVAVPRLAQAEAELDIEDALQLMLNWGGRLIAAEERHLDPEDLQELYYRSMIAAGDALLIAHQAYVPFEKQRAEYFHHWQREAGQPWLRELGYLYQEALQYKLLPSDFIPQAQGILGRKKHFMDSFLRAYFALFEQHASQTTLDSFEHSLLQGPLRQLNLREQLKALRANYNLYRLQGFHSDWYRRSPLLRLYYLMPFILLREQFPERKTLRAVMPSLPEHADWENLSQAFLALWQDYTEELL